MFNAVTAIVPVSSHFSNLKIFIQQNEQTSLQEQRLSLRQTLVETLRQHGHSPSTNLLDLTQLPKDALLSLSLSHCPSFNALAWIPRPTLLGLDIEERTRLKKKTTSRVCTDKELIATPNWELLWSCKEAVFKCFPEIKTLSFVEIFDWQSLHQDTWGFKARESLSQKPLSGSGEVHLILGHVLAFFISST